MIRQGTSKDAEFVFCWPPTAGLADFPWNSLPGETLLEETKISFMSGYQLNIVCGLETGPMSTSPFSSRELVKKL